MGNIQMRDNQIPSEEIIDEVRHIASFNLTFSQRRANELGEQAGLRTYLGDQFRLTLNELELNISYKKSKNYWGNKPRTNYIVSHKGAIQLEFVDLIGGENCHELESVLKYHPGEWVTKLKTAYQQSKNIKSKLTKAFNIIKQLSSNNEITCDEIVKLVEATEDEKETIKFLSLTSLWETACIKIASSYTFLGRIKEAEFVYNTLVSTHPENADCHLTLAQFFVTALINSTTPSYDAVASLRDIIESLGNPEKEMESFKKTDPLLYNDLIHKEKDQERENVREILSPLTIEALGCDFDYATKVAEEYILKALQLSTNTDTTMQAKSALSTLKRIIANKNI
jgi:hypothetical protein